MSLHRKFRSRACCGVRERDVDRLGTILHVVGSHVGTCCRTADPGADRGR
jgi:hypothetical protein